VTNNRFGYRSFSLLNFSSGTLEDRFAPPLFRGIVLLPANPLKPLQVSLLSSTSLILAGRRPGTDRGLRKRPDAAGHPLKNQSYLVLPLLLSRIALFYFPVSDVTSSGLPIWRDSSFPLSLCSGLPEGLMRSSPIALVPGFFPDFCQLLTPQFLLVWLFHQTKGFNYRRELSRRSRSLCDLFSSLVVFFDRVPSSVFSARPPSDPRLFASNIGIFSFPPTVYRL